MLSADRRRMGCPTFGWCQRRPFFPRRDVEAIWGTAADDITAIWGSGPAEVVAVGDGGRIVHFDGRRWTQQQSYSLADLRAVWRDDDGVFLVVGEDGTLLRSGPSGWSPLESGTHRDLLALWGSGPDQEAVEQHGAGSRRPGEDRPRARR